MKKILLLSVLAIFTATLSAAEKPLRVFIRAGVKTHGPGQHDHPKFLEEWKALLNQRGAKCDGAMEFPTAAQLDNTDVLVLYCAHGGAMTSEQKSLLDNFTKRGGGVVVIHDAIVSGKDADWFKTVVGGAWQDGTAKWLEGPTHLYYIDLTHPITAGAANFQFDDEIYYDLNMTPEARVLAAAYTPKITGRDKRGQPGGGKVSVYDIQPQMWVYEKDNYRAFVSIPGHNHASFSLPHFRAALLRGIAWTGKRTNLDEFASKEEVASLRYPEGGPIAPEKAAAKIEVHPDFNMSLVAAEPLINKVMNVDWDGQGRLWVAETPEYPDGRWANRRDDLVQKWIDGAKLTPDSRRYDRPAHDRISILSDTNGDGRMDKKDIFFEGLELVTSFVFYKDGVIAAAAPDIWWLRDTNGDGKAEQEVKLYTGLGTGDTHAVINNLRWGLDGWIYATHGYSGSGKVTNGDGSKNFGAINSGVVRFRPDGSAMEQYCSKGGNTWGLQVTWDNEIFFTQPTSGELLMNVVLSEDRIARGKVGNTPSFKVVRRSPKSYPAIPYTEVPYLQIDLVGSFTASAGTVIYDGGTWPAAWNYNYFTTEPTINLIHHEIVTSEGPSYKMTKAPNREETEFIRGRDMWFRPIEVRVAPDGSMYIVDFYNQAVGHNDTRGTKHGPRNAAIRPDRDHYYGRLWRVDHKQAQKIAIPNLASATSAQLVASLEHPNRHVRFNAHRQLIDLGKTDAAPALRQMFATSKFPEARVASLWTLAQLGQLDTKTFAAAANDADAAVRKNAMQSVAAMPPSDKVAKESALKLLTDADPQVRLEAVNALATIEMDAEIARALVAAYPSFTDNWSRAAFFGAAAKSPAIVMDAALSNAPTDDSESMVRRLTKQIADAQNAPEAAKLVVAISQKPASADALKQTILESLAAGLKPDTLPAWSPDLQKALQTLVTSSSPQLSAATLPLVSRWDKGGAMKDALQGHLKSLVVRVQDASQSEDARVQIAQTLLGVRRSSPDALPAVAKLLGGKNSPTLQRRVIEAVGEIPDVEAGAALIAAFPSLQGDLQSLALEQLLKRAPWSLALLDALESGKIDASAFGPANLHRLRLHPDAAVASRANVVIDKVRGPETKQKDELIAKLMPVVSKAGSADKGKEVFTKNCSTCHKLGDIGRDVGPPLVGIGTHGPDHLLTQILDPNREVDPSFSAWAIQTNDGESYDGIIARENKSAVTLRNAAGEQEIRVNQIQSRRNAGRSLMPEGFEQLGGEALRDLLTFLGAAEQRFRFVDLTTAFTADSRYGLYWTQDQRSDTLKFVKFGAVTVEGVPFFIADPAKMPSAKNLIVLKGGAGNSFSKTKMPKKVEAKVGFAANRLHFLGGVGGWAHPLGGENVPVMKATVIYADGLTEEIIMHNSQEFADYIRVVNVPGSKLAEELVSENQLRWYTKPLKRTAVIERLVLESYDNDVAPTTVAITAEMADANAQVQTPTPAAAAQPEPLQWDGNGLKVLLVGGGSSHDFKKWFNQADAATLKATGKFAVAYTEKVAVAESELAGANVLVLSTNQGNFSKPEFRKALADFANTGKGIIILHPGAWYNWGNWPDYNKTIVGGGSRGHDALGEFEVKVTATSHPILKDVPATFKITDELYWFEPDASGAPIEILATAYSKQKSATYPSIWIVKHPKTRIVGIALGHDGRAHELPAFKALLQNAVQWVSGK